MPVIGLVATKPDRYRVKPEPEEIWVNKYWHGQQCVHTSEGNAVLAATRSGRTLEYVAKRFVEPDNE